jgi:hypothetical protein
MKKKMDELEKQGAEIDHEVEVEDGEEEEPVSKTEPDVSKIVGQPRRRSAKIQDDDEDDFEPKDAESESSEEDEQIEEELAKELAEKKQRQKRHIHSDEEAEEPRPAKSVSKPPPRVAPQISPASRRPTVQKTPLDNGSSKIKPQPIKRQETQESQRVSTPEDPTPPAPPNRRGGRRKSDVPKSPPKTAPRRARQSTAQTPSSSKSRPLQKIEQMRPPIHHPSGQHQPITSQIAYITPQQSVAYGLPPHIRQIPTAVHYVPQSQHVMAQPGYEYYGM